MATQRCAGSIYGQHGEPERDGKCPWCGVRVSPGYPKPKLDPKAVSELEHHYRTFYDPDYGSAR